ncbi:MAG TPA: TetR/AcrR family transcriptional regulator [Gaiellaceae bacterium]
MARASEGKTLGVAAGRRSRDPERTRNEILEVATEEFSQHGLHGGRVDEIAARTRTTKRMIYYYFGGKKQLYVAVLERAYATIRAAERDIDIDQSDPKAAIRRLAELTFDHHESHPDFVRLVSIENIDRAEHLANGDFRNLNSPAIELITKILEKGYAEGVFRRSIDPLDLHMMISSFCFFRVANRHTFKAIFARDLVESRRREHYRRMLGDMVVDYLTAADEGPPRSSRRSAR